MNTNWGDSDSDSEDELIPRPSMLVQQNKEDQDKQDEDDGFFDGFSSNNDHHQNNRRNNAQGGGSMHGRKGQHHRQQPNNFPPNRNNIRIQQPPRNNYRNNPRNNKPRNQGYPPLDWKETARKSQKYGVTDDTISSSTSGIDSINANNWMQQRRAKEQQKMQEQEKMLQERKERLEQEKLAKKKKQLEALKLVVMKRKEEDLQLQKEEVTMEKPITILKKEKKVEDDDIGKVTEKTNELFIDDTSQQKEPQYERKQLQRGNSGKQFHNNKNNRRQRAPSFNKRKDSVDASEGSSQLQMSTNKSMSRPKLNIAPRTKPVPKLEIDPHFVENDKNDETPGKDDVKTEEQTKLNDDDNVSSLQKAKQDNGDEETKLGTQDEKSKYLNKFERGGRGYRGGRGKGRGRGRGRGRSRSRSNSHHQDSNQDASVDGQDDSHTDGQKGQNSKTRWRKNADGSVVISRDRSNSFQRGGRGRGRGGRHSKSKSSGRGKGSEGKTDTVTNGGDESGK
ncbi:predicted protein [Chaetoceros tenuissimus]|uniref:Uncharacterized protein n=1 Tax=Chaetoceros tenuissimus TaxID=426638 RepID=A0AAD3H0Z4_9STRA|nr:predicted protein [Chaetoceros tenuissimus]